MVIGTIIYSKKLKEQLEDICGIHPIAVIENPFKIKLHSWIFEKTDELSFAIKKLTEKGEVANGDSNLESKEL